MEEKFLLRPPKPPKKSIASNQPATRQALLLVDMNDLPGQQTLFQLNAATKEIEDERETETAYERSD